MSTTKKTLPPKQQPKTFTIEELAEYWRWSVSEVTRHIRDGHLKRTLVTDTRPDLLRDCRLYRCDEDTRLLFRELEDEMPSGEHLLQCIWEGTPLNHFVDPVIPKNIIHCSDYEYLYIPGDKALEVTVNKEHKVRYFYDLDGSLLIPIIDGTPHYEDEDCIDFVGIEKHIYDSPLISFEAVERFMVENTAKRKDKEGTDAETIKDRQRRIVKIIRRLKKNPEHLLDERGENHIKDKVRKIYVEEKMHEKIVDWLGYTLESFTESKKDTEEYKAKVKQFERNGLHKKQEEFFNKAWGKLYRENKNTGYYGLRISLEDLFKIKKSK